MLSAAKNLRILSPILVSYAAISPLAAQKSADGRDSIPAEVVALGKRIFEGKTGGALCVTCHAVNAKGITGLGPNLTDATWLHGDGSRAFIEQLIKAGVMKPKVSAAVMPPMGGASLEPEQIKAVAAYVYTMSRASK